MDERTLFFVNALLALTAATVLLAYRRYQVTWPGFAWWTAGTFGVSAGYLLLAARPWLPALLVISANHACFLLMALLRIEGIRRFLGRSSLLYPGLTIVALEQALVLYFSLAYDSVAVRTTLVMLGLGSGCLLMAIPLWQHRPHNGSSLPYRLLAATQTVYASIMFLRAGYLPFASQVTTHVEWQFLTAVFLAEVSTGIAFLLVQGKRLEEKLIEAQSELTLSVSELQKAIEEVRTLSGLLPICAGCKKIRDDQGYWNEVEIYVQKHTDAEFTHGLCPECCRRLYPELEGEAG